MGFLRKTLFVGTGGLSGAVGIKANSKKERIAKSLEHQERASQRTTVVTPVASDASQLDELTKATDLHDRGVLPDDQFDAIKTRLLTQIAAEEERVAAANRAVAEEQARKHRATAEKQARKERAANAGAAKGEAVRERLGASGSGLGMTIKSPNRPYGATAAQGSQGKGTTRKE